jgi:hypothetical protein
MKFLGIATLALFLTGGLAAQGPGPRFKDENKDGKCDICGRERAGRQDGQQRGPRMRGNCQGRGHGHCGRYCCGQGQQESAKPAPQAEQK